MEWIFLAGACIGTGLQFVLALMDLRETRHAALHWSVAEDELVAEQRPWRRHKTRRELRTWRPSDIDRDIQRINLSLASWVILLAASAGALAVAEPPWR